MAAESWLDVIDKALCDLAAHAEEYYTDEVADAHGRLQLVLAADSSGDGEPFADLEEAAQ
jgi:hypothetical protein